MGTSVGRAALARWHRLPALAVDAALATGFVAALLAEHALTGPGLSPAAVVTSAFIGGPLVLRRRAPLLAYLVASIAIFVEALALTPAIIAPYANLVGIYSVGLYARGRRVWWGPPLAVAGVSTYFAALGPITSPAPAGVVFSWLLVWALGYSTARRRAEFQRAEHLRRRQAIADERARIARELHDLVGHTVNVMLVQVGAARRLIDREPARSVDLLSTVEGVGRDALDELDRLLGILRTGEGDELAEPDLSGLPVLAQRMGEAGVRVTTEVDAATLPHGISRCAYRIVQEALTNALKHGRAAQAHVSVHRGESALTVEVVDDGRGAGAGYRPGRGLLGAQERAAIFGGAVEHGPGPRGGFRLRAVLPLP
jgi:signal transduction histidine kinase